MGLLLAVVVHPANIQDRDGARLVIDKLIGRFPRLRLIWADAGYSGQLVDWVMSMSGWVLEIVKRPRASHQFEVLPRRWVVERTLAWLGRCRRLSKDYEPGFPILGVFRLKGQPNRDGSIIVRSCKATQSPVYPMRDAIAVVEHPSCPSSSSSCPLPVG